MDRSAMKKESPSRRYFCKKTLAAGLALGVGHSLNSVQAAPENCTNSTRERAFADTFYNIPESFGPTRVAFENPLPDGLEGSLYRNGPARMSRGDTRYDHWFDGDGMVHAFSLQQNTLVHKARMVRTDRYIAEEQAGRYLWSGFGTGFDDSRPVFNPDTINVANTSVLPVGGELLALWEAGSPYRVHAETLETLGRHVFSSQTDGLPFSAHPRVDPNGGIWNFGYLSGSGKLALYDLNSSGSLNRVQVIDAPNADMVHDFAITEDYLVFVLLPLRLESQANPASSFLDNLNWDEAGAVEVLIVDKQHLQVVKQFQLPAFFAFHLGNAWQEGDTIKLEIATASDFNALMSEITAATNGQFYNGPEIKTQTSEISLSLASNIASINALPTQGVDFPRFDQRFTGMPTQDLFMLARSEAMPANVFGFDTITAMNRRNDTESLFNYGSTTLVEEHIFVPAPGRTAGHGWLVGTSYNWKKCRSSLSVFDAQRIEDGPITQAHLPYGLPMGLHGQYVTA